VTFKELQEELYNRGFSDLEAEAARVKRWLNAAMGEIADFAPWPFLEGSKQAKAPMVIADLGHVLDVTDLAHDNQLGYADRRELVSIDPNLSSSGIAERWYLEGETSFKVYPADVSSEFLVRYLKSVADLVADGDTPIVPAKYHELIVEGAVIRAYRNRDNYEAASLVRSEWKLGIENMVKALIKRNFDGERRILRTGLPGDYL
jgi:hypothetical protein